MWNNTRVTQLLNIDYPIFQGPFGGRFSSPELVATVSNSGGLGGYGAYTLSPQEIFETDQQIKAQTNQPYNLNLWVSDADAPGSPVSDADYKLAQTVFQPYFDELGLPFPEKPAPFQSRFQNQLQAILDIKPRVFSFVFGILPADIMEQCRRAGIITIGAATTPDEAVALEDSGVDMIIASGFEAGGHRPSFLAPAESSTMGTSVLLQLVREKVKVPIIAAGGIADGRGTAAALLLGAEAVQIGTAFLACDESNIMPIHRQQLFSPAAKHTTLTRAFTGRLGRGISNSISRGIAGKENAALPFPLQSTLLSSLRKAAIDQEQWDKVFFWSGQIAPLLKHRKAQELMQSLIVETTATFNRLKTTFS
ncbi:nitronate monooxygenase [Chitinophaga sp. G-6-1-13]|uniref:Propionate 3-nitronate monooxygenase n=1 Tax=Chitinophaga fulva TaxID=2728842 RepID=A0A848GUP2_9BACT|nr:nitronate monooxygenase [Chitinophaga fulva]NML41059.1 nitronate monooxygenase [Chitinophaga fulva]